MKEATLRTKIGNVTLNLPIYRDKQTTQALAESVSEVVAEIEASADRIDTQAFALRAAYTFAYRLKELEEQNDADLRELLKALDGTASALQRIVEEYDNKD